MTAFQHLHDERTQRRIRMVDNFESAAHRRHEADEHESMFVECRYGYCAAAREFLNELLEDYGIKGRFQG